MIHPSQKIKPYPGCPTLAWFIRRRISDPMVKLDCTIMVRGKKGVSKSVSSVGLSLAVAYELARRRPDHDWRHFFTVEDHLKTVDQSGTMEMFTGDIVRRKNSILLADDVSISADSKDAMSNTNRYLGKIMTVTRIYQNLTIMNTVYSTHVDKKVRGFADIIIDMIGINRETKQAIGKVYWYDVNQHTGKEYIAFFRWRGKRIKYFLFDLPPKFIVDQYERLREKKTGAFLDEVKEKRGAKKGPGPRQIAEDAAVKAHSAAVLAMMNEGKSQSSIRRATGLSNHMIDKIIFKAGCVKDAERT